MTYTDAELKAAIEAAIAIAFQFGGDTLTQSEGATLRAYLETFDEERAFLEAARRICGNRPNIADFDALHEANRALVAKREGKK